MPKRAQKVATFLHGASSEGPPEGRELGDERKGVELREGGEKLPVSLGAKGRNLAKFDSLSSRTHRPNLS